MHACVNREFSKTLYVEDVLLNHLHYSVPSSQLAGPPGRTVRQHALDEDPGDSVTGVPGHPAPSEVHL